MIVLSVVSLLFILTDCSIAWLIALLPVLWLVDTFLTEVLFIAIMRMKEVRDAGKLPEDYMWLYKTFLGIGLFQDCTYNLTWAILVYVDIPKELLVTARLKRYAYDEKYANTWRRSLTKWFAKVLLDPFDPSGKHI